MCLKDINVYLMFYQIPLVFYILLKILKINQGSQYRIRDCIGLVSGTIYFEYRLILVYCFGFTAIFYIYK